MKNKKGFKLVIILMLLVYANCSVNATSFEGQEEYYSAYCSIPRNSKEEASTCVAFRSYMQENKAQIDSSIGNLDNAIASIQWDMDGVSKKIKGYETIIEELNQVIAQNEALIQTIHDGLVVLEVDILQIQADIEVRDELIKSRMVSEQTSIGLHKYIDFVMGSKDIMELMRVVEGLQRITENDQNEIAILNEDRAELEQKVNEETRLKEEAEQIRNENEQRVAQQEVYREEQEKLMHSFKEQEADLLQEKRSQQSRYDAVQSAIIHINVDVNNGGSVPPMQPSGGWQAPVHAGLGEGTFFYSGGGFHGGADYPVSIGTAIHAPINGIVVYSSNPYGTNSGYYPGNSDGWPYGAGNSVHMIGQANGTTYGVSFFHMKQENWQTTPGQVVNQGTIIGYSGNSGRTTGPHLHVEVINLGSMDMAQAISRFQNTLDFAWGTGWNSTSTACAFNGGSTPCRERAELFF